MKQLMRRSAVAVAIGGLLLLALAPGFAVAADGAVSINEVSEKYRFDPKGIEVAVGTEVSWTNDSDAPHTVTADDDAFTSEQFGEGETYSRTFDTAGEFPYHCEIHDYMTGTVTVLAAGATPPATDIGAPGTTTPPSVPWFPILAGALALIVLSGWVLLPRRVEKS